MSHEVKSQISEESSNYASDEDMEEEDIYNYYEPEGDESDMEQSKEEDPEFFAYDLLRVEDVERLLNECVEAVCKATTVSVVPGV